MHWDHRVGRRLKLRDLNILLAVAEAGSMAKAAKQLAISQPAISRAVADIEHTLGVQLLDRSPQGIEPTRYGQALLKRGVTIFDELKQSVADIEFLADPAAGELWIGSSPGLADGVVLAVIERLSRQCPRVVFHAVPSGAVTMCDDLRERRLELGIVGLTGLASDEDMDAEALFVDPLVVVAGPENSWARRRKIDLAELVNEPWTWPAVGTFVDALVVKAFRASGLTPPRAAVYADAYSMRIRLAATGRFLAVVPASVMKFHARHVSLKVLPVELPTTQRQIGVITLKNRTLSPLAQLFIECAREVAKPLAKGQAPSRQAKSISVRSLQTT
jgi:DNA-binding transcriptional LysR family regulator